MCSLRSAIPSTGRFPSTRVSLREHLQKIGAKRVLLTHMSTDMLEQVSIEGAEMAQDGMVLEI